MWLWSNRFQVRLLVFSPYFNTVQPPRQQLRHSAAVSLCKTTKLSAHHPTALYRKLKCPFLTSPSLILLSFFHPAPTLAVFLHLSPSFLSPGAFALNETTGVISTAKPLDYEANSSFVLKVEADSMRVASSNLRAPSKSKCVVVFMNSPPRRLEDLLLTSDCITADFMDPLLSNYTHTHTHTLVLKK